MAASSSAHLVAAIDGFQAVLTPEQKVEFLAHSGKPDATSVILFMTKIDDENATRRQRGVSSRLFGVLESIRGFSEIVDTFVSSHPNIAALVWGSIKFVILAANNITIFFEKLSECFLRLGKYCPRYSEYQALFVNSTRLQKSLSRFYATIINFCAEAYRYIQNAGTTLAQALWRPYEKEFGDFESTLRTQNDEVEAEIHLASEQAADMERKAAAEYRRIEIISRSKAIKDAHERRLLKDQRNARVEREKLLDKLSSHDYWGAMRRIPFIDWLEDANSSTLWLSGILGSGKSTVTAAVIEFLLTRPPQDQNHLCFFFCEYDNLSSLDTRTILGTLIRQCLSESNMSDVIEARLKGLIETPFMDVKDLESLLQLVAATPGTLILIIDGFDECRKPDRIITLKVLQRLLSSSRSKVKIFLSSPEDVIGDIDRVFTTCHHVCMDCEETHADILAYVEDLIDEKMLNGELEVGDPQLKHDIQRALANGANGMFLWVAFQLEDLCHQKCDADIRKALRTLPRDLTETYGRILTRIIKDRNEQIVGKIFRWVAAAKRPLFLDELQQAIAVEPTDSYLRKDRLVTNINNLISWCNGLVILQEEDSAVQFTHHSVKQFLLSDRYDTIAKSFHLQLSEADHEVGEICVTYLHFNDFERQVSRLPKHNLPFQPKDFAASTFISSSNRAARYGTKFVKILSNKARPTTPFDITERLNNSLPKSLRDNSKDQLYSGYPLLPYVQQFWLSHTTGFLPENTSMWNSWAALIIRKHDLVKIPWMMQCDEEAEEVITNYILAEDHLALLHLYGHQHPLTNLTLSKLLIEASGKGNIRIVDGLIDAKIDINHSIGPGSRTAVLAAAENGHIRVLKSLLTAKALMYGRVFDKEYALEAAAQRGHLEVVKWLLSTLAEGSWHIKCLPAALALAVAGEHEKLMELLVKAHHNVHASVDDDIVCAVARSGPVKVMELLLTAGADVDIQKPYICGETPLREAVKSGRTEMAKLLLAAHAQVDVRDTVSGRTALHEAAGRGHTEMVKVLLAANADANAVDRGELTPLMLASHEGHVEVVRILLRATADEKIISRNYRQTPLHEAASRGHIETVRLLLTTKIDVNFPDRNGDTALHLGAWSGHLEIVKALLAANAEVNHVNLSEQTAMDRAQRYSRTAVIKVLKAAKAKTHRQLYD